MQTQFPEYTSGRHYFEMSAIVKYVRDKELQQHLESMFQSYKKTDFMKALSKLNFVEVLVYDKRFTIGMEDEHVAHYTLWSSALLKLIQDLKVHISRISNGFHNLNMRQKWSLAHLPTLFAFGNA